MEHKSDQELHSEALTLLKTYWGYDEFRTNQWEAILNVVRGKDTFVLMSTGSGKSTCYMIPSLLTQKCTIVVSPLIALMEDQVTKLNSMGIPAVALNSNTPINSDLWQRSRDGEFALIYMSPERLMMWLDVLQEMHEYDIICMVAFDESHMISEWGHNFRPDYRQVCAVREQFPTIPLMALTATATNTVAEDIMKVLGLNNPMKLKTTANRINLAYSFLPKTNLEQDLTKEMIGNNPCIVYCMKRDDTERISKHLNSIGICSRFYHAGLSNEEKTKIHHDFLRDTIPVIVCTIAFGMGIDKADIGTIIHYGVPQSLEEYQQQTGRAGRDGSQAKCVLFWNSKDLSTGSFLAQKQENKSNAIEMFGAMKKLIKTKHCRRKVILEYFGESQENGFCGNCDICSNIQTTATTPDREESLVNQLKQFRIEEAKRLDIAPYMIMSNKTLDDLARKHPTNERELYQVSGFGEFKVKKYGSAILSIINAYLSTLASSFSTSTSTSTSTGSQRKRKYSVGNSQMETWSMHQSGKSISEIAAARNLKESTIVDHLENVIEYGNVERSTIKWDLIHLPTGMPNLSPEDEFKLLQVLKQKYQRTKATIKQLQDACQIEGQWCQLRLLKLKFYNQNV